MVRPFGDDFPNPNYDFPDDIPIVLVNPQEMPPENRLPLGVSGRREGFTMALELRGGPGPKLLGGWENHRDFTRGKTG